MKTRSFLMKSARIGFSVLLLVAASTAAQVVERPEGWTDESHGSRAPANYELVLPDDQISEIYITFTPESWQAEQDDMIEIYGEPGTSEVRGPGGGGPGRLPLPDISELAESLGRSESEVGAAMAFMPDFAAVLAALEMEAGEFFEALGVPGGFPLPGGPGGPTGIGGRSNLQLADRNPIWVPVTIQFGSETWWEAGFRFKGNSTLTAGWRTGTSLPFKLDFDEFEDEHPELDNQRFYGFKQLSFSVGLRDASFQREKVGADILREAGVPAAETAFYAVYVDTGMGDDFQYWGMYTAVELPDDTLIETQFADDSGNMYKPGGRGANFAAGSFTEAGFDKETNRSGSYDDVLAVFDALHAETRRNDPGAWRENLETVFDVDGFLRWLATNTLMQNWDTYGVLAHNYYLYADKTTGQLVWIPWDNNESLRSNVGAGDNTTAAGGRGLGFGTALNLSLEGLDMERWPLIGFLANDPVYYARYVELVEEVSADVFTPARMTAIYEANYALLAEYLQAVEGEDAVKAARAAADELIEHVQQRTMAAEQFLAG